MFHCIIFNDSKFTVTCNLLNCIIVDPCQTASMCVLVVKSFSLNLVVFICQSECLSLMSPCNRHFTSSRGFFHIYCSSNNFRSIHLFLPFHIFFFIIVDLHRHFGCIAQVFSFPSWSLGEVVQERLIQLQMSI